MQEFRFFLRCGLAVVFAASACAQLTVNLAAPTDGSIAASPASVGLAADATPSAGASITNVQFFANGILLGQAATAPFGYSWPGVPAGRYLLQATAFDSSGANASSPPAAFTVLQSLPWFTDFEAADGYALGSLAGQLGWSVTQGSAQIVSTDAYSGTQSVQLVPSSPPAEITNVFAPTDSGTVGYIDVYAKPAADATVTSSSLIETESASIGFLRSGESAIVQVFDGNGSGSGSWVTPAIPSNLALGAGTNQTSAWHRFTLREDYTAKTWDLYVDGQLVGYDFGFLNASAASPNSLGMTGHVTSPVELDLLYSGPINPLFANAANDGIADTWKQQWGLPTNQNLRYVFPSGNGTTALQEYLTGANPLDFFSGRAIAITSPVESSQISYTYDGSNRLTAAKFGSLSSQSLTLDNATNVTGASTFSQPIVAWRLANSLAPDGSGMGADAATPAGDSVPNLAKYALGLTPSVAVLGSCPTISLVQSSGSSYLALEYHRPDPPITDLTYIVEVSADGGTWSSGASATTTVSTTVSGGTADLIVQDNTPVSAPQYGRAIRLRILRNLLSQ